MSPDRRAAVKGRPDAAAGYARGMNPKRIKKGMPQSTVKELRAALASVEQRLNFIGLGWPLVGSSDPDGLALAFDETFEYLRPLTISLSGDTNDLQRGGNFTRLDLAPAASLKITGLCSGVNGVRVWLANTDTANTITLGHQATASDAVNRFWCAGAVDYVLGPGQYVPAFHDGTYWHVGSQPGGSVFSLTNSATINLGADQNNYTLPAQTVVYLNPTVSTVNLTGFVAANNREVHLYNVSTSNLLVLKYESASSTATNRFKFPWGYDLVLPPGAKAVLYYDPVQTRWLVQLPTIAVPRPPTPPTITSPQDPYSAPLTPFIPVAPSGGTVSLISIDRPHGGRKIKFLNTDTTLPIVLPHDSGATPSQGFYTPTRTSAVMPPQGLLDVIYDESASRYRVWPSWPTFIPGKPAQITADQNDYAGQTGYERDMFVTSDASRNITGFAKPWPGRRLSLFNTGSNPIVLRHQNAGSAAANRLISPTAADWTLAAGYSVDLFYDDGSSRWRIVKPDSPSAAATSPVIFSVTGTTTVDNTTTETSVINSGAGGTVAGNRAVVGDTVRWDTSGMYTTTGTPSLRHKVKLGSTAICDTGGVTMPNTSSTFWRFSGIGTYTAVGASAVVEAYGKFEYSDGAGGYITVPVFAAPSAAFDSTADQLLDVTAKWGTASPSNSVDCRVGLAELVH
jgi:hypothetical protein